MRPVEILQNTFSDQTRCIAQLRPGVSFPLSALRFLDSRALPPGMRRHRGRPLRVVPRVLVHHVLLDPQTHENHGQQRRRRARRRWRRHVLHARSRLLWLSIVSNDDPSPSFSAAAVAVPAQQQAPAQQVMNQPVRGPPQADAAGAQRKKAAPGAGGMLGDMMNPMALPMGAALFAFVGAVLILVGTHGMFKLDPYDYYYGRGDGTSIGLLDTVTARRPLSDLAF